MTTQFVVSKWDESTGYTVDEASLFFWKVFSIVKLAVIHATMSYPFITRRRDGFMKGTIVLSNVVQFWNICWLLRF